MVELHAHPYVLRTCRGRNTQSGDLIGIHVVTLVTDANHDTGVGIQGNVVHYEIGTLIGIIVIVSVTVTVAIVVFVVIGVVRAVVVGPGIRRGCTICPSAWIVVTGLVVSLVIVVRPIVVIIRIVMVIIPLVVVSVVQVSGIPVASGTVSRIYARGTGSVNVSMRAWVVIPPLRADPVIGRALAVVVIVSVVVIAGIIVGVVPVVAVIVVILGIVVIPVIVISRSRVPNRTVRTVSPEISGNARGIVHVIAGKRHGAVRCENVTVVFGVRFVAVTIPLDTGRNGNASPVLRSQIVHLVHAEVPASSCLRKHGVNGTLYGFRSRSGHGNENRTGFRGCVSSVANVQIKRGI